LAYSRGGKITVLDEDALEAIASGTEHSLWTELTLLLYNISSKIANTQKAPSPAMPES
jgi:hypothetical protein